jgi:hypothetical protein
MEIVLVFHLARPATRESGGITVFFLHHRRKRNQRLEKPGIVQISPFFFRLRHYPFLEKELRMFPHLRQ